jgi:hypothetical protein
MAVEWDIQTTYSLYSYSPQISTDYPFTLIAINKQREIKPFLHYFVHLFPMSSALSEMTS